jgi:hypothetical protein
MQAFRERKNSLQLCGIYNSSEIYRNEFLHSFYTIKKFNKAPNLKIYCKENPPPPLTH